METVRWLERGRYGQTVAGISGAVLAELAMKRMWRAAELVAEAIRMARAWKARAEIAGSRWQVRTCEVRCWALGAGFERLLITADSGGSNGSRLRLWKTELVAFAAETGLDVSVLHLPPGASKWNIIEHRLF